MLIERTVKLKVGTADTDDFRRVINESQLNGMIRIIQQASGNGAHIITGGKRLTGTGQEKGFFMAPTIIDNVSNSDAISTTELFGPVVCLSCVKNFEEAVSLANNTQYGLTACIHLRNIHRAIEFTQRVQTGVAVINAGTYGSEPHMPFGGMKQSGNGTREPGTEALDVYSEIRDIYIVVDEKEL